MSTNLNLVRKNKKFNPKKNSQLKVSKKFKIKKVIFKSKKKNY